jgi:hypothetical protein
MNQTLYQKILGNSFFELPDSLQSFHSNPTGGAARGYFTIDRGNNLFCKIFSLFLFLPKPGSNVLTKLFVRIENQSEIWDRSFGDKRLITKQWFENGLLIEKSGLMIFFFRTFVRDKIHYFESVKFRFWRLPIPNFLAPCVKAITSGTENGWNVRVEISFAKRWTVLTYYGDLKIL